MSAQQYFSFLQKITRKLAETFMQLNQICLHEMSSIQSQLANQQSPPKPSEPIPEPELNPIQIDSPQDPTQRSPKTKKIKKDNTLQDEEKESQSIKGKKKAKKVSHKPKAPASSFLLFFKDQQANISETYPSFGVTDLTKVAAKLWNDLSNEEKEPYIKQGDEERKIYQQKMQQYRKQFPDEIAEKEKDRLLKKEKKSGLRETAKKQKVEGGPSKNALPENKIQEPQKVSVEQQWQSADLGDEGDDSLGMV